MWKVVQLEVNCGFNYHTLCCMRACNPNCEGQKSSHTNFVVFFFLSECFKSLKIVLISLMFLCKHFVCGELAGNELQQHYKWKRKQILIRPVGQNWIKRSIWWTNRKEIYFPDQFGYKDWKYIWSCCLLLSWFTGWFITQSDVLLCR